MAKTEVNLEPHMGTCDGYSDSCLIPRHFFLMTFKIFLFIYLGFAKSSLLHGLFSGHGKWGLLSNCSTWASHCNGFSCCGAQALGSQASVVVAHGLSICGPWALEHRLRSYSAVA